MLCLCEGGAEPCIKSESLQQACVMKEYLCAFVKKTIYFGGWFYFRHQVKTKDYDSHSVGSTGCS
jgi:hypothetical protein